MLKDPTAFRNRFQAWKETGESQYEAGLPKYNDGKDKVESKLFNEIERAVRFIAQHEGFVDHVYEDTHASQKYAKKYGYWSDKHQKYVLPTAGYGWTAKKDLKNWTKKEALERLREDVKRYYKNGEKLFPNWARWTPGQRNYWADMQHQGGEYVHTKMPKFVAAAKEGNWKEAEKHLDYASEQTPDRNRDRIAMWYDSQDYRNKEFKNVAKEIAQEKNAYYEPVDFTVYKKPILPVERNFDPDVPETISIKNTFDSPIEKVIKAIDAKIAFNRILKNLSLEELNPWSTPQIEDIMAGQVFNKLTMPQITNL